MLMYVRSYLLILKFENLITDACSPRVVYLCEFPYYVVRQEHAVPMHHTLWHIVLLCHQNDGCENLLPVCVC